MKYLQVPNLVAKQDLMSKLSESAKIARSLGRIDLAEKIEDIVVVIRTSEKSKCGNTLNG